MIRLTRLNKQPIGVNSDLIKFVENSPDTLITLITGEKILVRESYQEIVVRMVAFRRRVLAGVDVFAYFYPYRDYVAGALRAGRIGMVTVHVPDAEDARAFETIGGDLRRIWRRPRALDRYA